MSNGLIGEIKEALRIVIDPELGENIVDLGFIYDVSVEGGDVHITMTATTRGCPATDFLKDAVANSIARVAGVESVDVAMTFEPPWTPSRIEPAIRASLGFAAVN
jgi:metal-sulfur cluster biosynthetic enzyme